jgi:hypothetical protein
MQTTEFRNPNNDIKWKYARWGVIIFCVIHLFLEVLLGNSKSAALPVMFNFWISGWYIKEQIAKGKEIKNLLLMGLGVSAVFFLIRLALGTIIFSLF